MWVVLDAGRRAMFLASAAGERGSSEHGLMSCILSRAAAEMYVEEGMSACDHRGGLRGLDRSLAG